MEAVCCLERWYIAWYVIWNDHFDGKVVHCVVRSSGVNF